MTNTPGLYDGSAEARAIIKDILDNYSPQEGLDFKEELTLEPMGVLRHILDYLKGKDVENLGMWTRELMEPLDELETLAIEQMVMDRSAVVTEEEPQLVQIAPLTFPDKPCGPVKEAVFDGDAEDYPGWNPNSNEPKTTS